MPQVPLQYLALLKIAKQSLSLLYQQNLQQKIQNEVQSKDLGQTIKMEESTEVGTSPAEEREERKNVEKKDEGI